MFNLATNKETTSGTFVDNFFHAVPSNVKRLQVALTPRPIILEISMGFSVQVGGWLADAFFGRYRVTHCGMRTMWFKAMLNAINLVIDNWLKLTT